jgi:hypothetical protein
MSLRFCYTCFLAAAVSGCDLEDPSVDVEDEPSESEIQSNCTIGTSTSVTVRFSLA